MTRHVVYQMAIIGDAYVMIYQIGINANICVHKTLVAKDIHYWKTVEDIASLQQLHLVLMIAGDQLMKKMLDRLPQTRNVIQVGIIGMEDACSKKVTSFMAKNIKKVNHNMLK